MANALKCDRCGKYFDYRSVNKNFIAFGHKNIIVEKNYPVNDICPDCMVEFMTWFEAPKKIEEEWTDEDCECIGCWECINFRKGNNIHNPNDNKGSYHCSYKKLYISGNMARPDYMDMRHTDFDRLGCKEEE